LCSGRRFFDHNSILELDIAPRRRGDAFAGDKNPSQVQRVCRCHGYRRFTGARFRLAARQA
jgi:hypothetical protein